MYIAVHALVHLSCNAIPFPQPTAANGCFGCCLLISLGMWRAKEGVWSNPHIWQLHEQRKARTCLWIQDSVSWFGELYVAIPLVHSQSVDSQSVHSPSVDSQSVDSQSVHSQSVDSQSVDSQSVDSQSVGSYNVTQTIICSAATEHSQHWPEDDPTAVHCSADEGEVPRTCRVLWWTALPQESWARCVKAQSYVHFSQWVGQ